MRAGFKRRVSWFAAVGATVAVAFVLGGGSQANATATGCSSFGSIVIKGIPIYSGSYCAKITGSGTYVSSVAGEFASGGNICNSTVTAEFFDSTGKWYKTYTSPLAKGCSRKRKATISINKRMSVGRMCSTLKTNGSRITSVCHSIF